MPMSKLGLDVIKTFEFNNNQYYEWDMTSKKTNPFYLK